MSPRRQPVVDDPYGQGFRTRNGVTEIGPHRKHFKRAGLFRGADVGGIREYKVRCGRFLGGSPLRNVLARLGVTTVFPGIVGTHLYDGVRGGVLVRVSMKLLLAGATSPEKLGRMIVQGIRKNKRIINQSLGTSLGYLFKRLIPWAFEAGGLAVAWMLRKERGYSV